MTTDEMRKLLRTYCVDAHCQDCPLYDTELNCGHHLTFEVISSDDVKECYNLVFGKEKHDNVEHPSHYETGKFECIEVMIEVMGVDAVKDFCVCNAFKYIYRHKRKNGLEDLEKAKWYIKKYIELSKESED